LNSAWRMLLHIQLYMRSVDSKLQFGTTCNEIEKMGDEIQARECTRKRKREERQTRG